MAQRWWTAPMEGDNGRTVIVTGRDNMTKIMESRKMPYLIRVSWRYESLPDGMPVERDAELMGRVHDAFEATFNKDKAAYLVAVFTGEGRRDWLFYTGNLNIFNKVFNRALADIDETVPFEIDAQSDPDWDEYREMYALTYIPEDDSETD